MTGLADESLRRPQAPAITRAVKWITDLVSELVDHARVTHEELAGWCGITCAGFRVTRPLIELDADGDGGRLTPRWWWLRRLVFREYTWSWAEVVRLDELVAPISGVHAVRIVLSARPAYRTRNGVFYRWIATSRQFVLALDPRDVEGLLALAPESIPRTRRRGLFAWR